MIRGVQHVLPVVLAAALIAALATPTRCLKAVGPYAMQICVDVTDYLVVGTVVSTDAFDPDKAERISRIEVIRSLHGRAAVGETLAVGWSTGREVQGEFVRIDSDVGPQLSEIHGRHLWFISDRTSWGNRCAYDPIPLHPSSRSEIAQQLEWAEHERIPYGGTMADPEHRKAKGVDLAVGDSLRVVVATYLAGYLDAMDND